MKIAIIGAGPRGLLMLERLLSWQQQQTTPAPLALSLYDPFPIAGHVWRTDQRPELIMNTPAQQITLYTDDSVSLAGGPVSPGPHLAQWAHLPEAAAFVAQQHYRYGEHFRHAMTELGDNDYAPRGLFGAYMQWFYAEQRKRATQLGVTVTFHQTTVTRLTPTHPGYTIQTPEGPEAVDQAVLQLGHWMNRLNAEEQGFADQANEYGLHYLRASHPGDQDLSDIAAHNVIIMRGLGLSFYDYTTLLTLGRGGSYHRDANGQLVYQPSGDEPHIVAGSRRGVPYYPKGHNEKGYGEQESAHFITIPRLQALSAAGPISSETFFNLLKSDVLYVYYSRLITTKYPTINLTDFQQQFLKAPNIDSFLTKYPFDTQDLLDWDHLLTPTRDWTATSDYQAFIAQWLQVMVADAKAGTKHGPLTSALETLRDLRDSVRYVVDHRLIDNDEFLSFFLRWFNPMNDFLAVGPPLARVEQLLALMAAGVVTILPPGMTVTTVDGQYHVTTTSQPTQSWQSDTLLEARLPGINATGSLNPLIRGLLQDSLADPDQRTLADGQTYMTHAIAVADPQQQLLDATEHPLPGLYFWGVPTEGQHWTTTTSPRPGVNDVNLRWADQIAKAMMTASE